MAKRYFYGVEFWSGRRTTTGQPNGRTGRYNIACDIQAFTCREDRNEWVEDGETTPAMAGNCREAVKYADIRSLCLGMDSREFTEDFIPGIREMADIG